MKLQTEIDKLTMEKKMQNSGQIAIVLLLFVLVALTIGLTVTQRSLNNITTSSQTEQVSRAFTAAEAGLERSLNEVAITDPSQTRVISQTDLNSPASANVNITTRLPRPGQALEYPPLGKDSFAQFWLADPISLSSNYQGTSLRVYYGNPGPDEPSNRPALEINLITRNGAGAYLSTRNFYDSTTNAADPRIGLNGFLTSNACNDLGLVQINTSSSNGSLSDRTFLCRVDLSIPAGQTPFVLRSRILYSNVKQPVAVQPVNNPVCPGSICSLPQQAAFYSSVGLSGQSQKTVQVFRETKFMPAFLDFAIFSSGSITK